MSMRCSGGDQRDPALEEASRLVFGWSGPHDTSGTALATLCQRPNANCNAGIALHGSSVSGLLSSMAPRFARGVTAALIWSSGSVVPGGHSCCGLYSNSNGNLTCCSTQNTSSPVVGGSSLECVKYNSTSRYLDKSRRRLTITTVDHEYGDCFHNPPDDIRHCDHERSMTQGAKHIGRVDSGYDCGNASHCIQADGSGYYVVSHEEMGLAAEYNAHNFYQDTRKTRYGGTHGLNPTFVNSDADWGFGPSFDWLASTARR